MIYDLRNNCNHSWIWLSLRRELKNFLYKLLISNTISVFLNIYLLLFLLFCLFVVRQKACLFFISQAETHKHFLYKKLHTFNLETCSVKLWDASVCDRLFGRQVSFIMPCLKVCPFGEHHSFLRESMKNKLSSILPRLTYW